MKRFLIGLCLLLLALALYAGDKISFIELSVPTAGVDFYFRHSALREVTIFNDDSTNYLIVDWNGLLPTSIDLADGVTTAGSAALTSATANFTTNGVEKGDLVWLHKGDANDGVYEIISVDSETQITLSKALSVTTTLTDFDIQDWRIKKGENQTYKLHGSQFSIKADTAAISARICIKHEIDY